MPTSSAAATVERKKSVRLPAQKSIGPNAVPPQSSSEKHLLQIASALPNTERRSLYVRSHSTLNATSICKGQDSSAYDYIALQAGPDGVLRVSRTQNEKERHPDRICLDRRGLTHIPVIEAEPRLRLLSLQHNLIIDIDTLAQQRFPSLVFLDLYDNQLEQLRSLEVLQNLRVLLIGKNRIKKVEGLHNLQKLEVLDLHGNQISHISGLNGLSELKVLNLAGNKIRFVGVKDLQGLDLLQELNLRRNRLRKLLGCGDLSSLNKLFLSNNDLQGVDDISSIAKSPNIKEISIDGNAVFLSGDCISFLVSYLPYLHKLNAMQITDQVRKAAMAWRRNKETTNAAFMDLTSETTLNCRREEVISNARTNWELLRSQTKCLTNTPNTAIDKSLKNLKPDSDFVLTSLNKPKLMSKSKSFIKLSSKVPLLPDKNLHLMRTFSQDTENSSSTCSTDLKLPPILLPIINKLEKRSGSLSSSVGPNIDSSSSLASGSEPAQSTSSSEQSDSESEDIGEQPNVLPVIENTIPSDDTLSNISSNASLLSTSESEKGSSKSSIGRSVKSAKPCRAPLVRSNSRAATAKPKKVPQNSPTDREQGGDYLIEICGRHLNIYGQGALRFVDKPWSPGKAHDVTTVKFNYVNFNSIVGFLCKVKHRFPNAEHFVFKETNLTCLGQLNALSEVQGLVALNVDPEGNALTSKDWHSYAIYRLAHWGLKVINDVEINEEDVQRANLEYQSLSDLVLWSLPGVLLQPLLARLRIDVNQGITEQNAKKWLMKADPALRSVVSKEALQWKKGALSQDDLALRQKARQHLSSLLDETTNAVKKLKMLDRDWPRIMHEFVQNTLIDYSQLDLYMKQKMQELSK
ncbi:leucine-rich repeat-containing protein 49 [Euwallacea similis]|uniref:leucine-rich repeat-containing protein 49 n=1 Tax=Euwallacea similis TaxID=1736056 RepID=UPI003450C44B